MLQGKRVFVSGGAGVIGRALVEKLHKMGAQLLVGDLKPRPREWAADIRYRRGDLNHISARELADFAPEYFFHLAATFERSTETYDFWHENMRHNVQLSHHLMTCLKDTPALRKVIFASSYLIYDQARYQFAEPAREAVRLSEEDPVNPRNLTGMAKLMHEIELGFLGQFGHLPFQSVSARIYRVYGKNSRDIVSRWIRALLAGETLTVYRKEGMFDYIYADDVAEGLLRLAQSSYSGIVNLGNGHARRVSEVLDVLRRHFPEMRTREEESDIPYEASEADMRLFRQITGWHPEYELETAIPQMIEFERRKAAGQAGRTEEGPGHILISSVSKKIPLVKAVKQAAAMLDPEVKVIGADADPACLGQYFTDGFWHMPRIKELTLEQLVEYCHEHRIRVIVPTRDGELAFFAENKKRLREQGIHVMISDPEGVNVCVDKLEFYRHGVRNGFPVIPTASDLAEIQAERFVVKERYGAGAAKIGLDLDRDSALEHGTTLQDPVYQPFIAGKEASVDVYVAQDGKVKGCVCRYRDVVVNGESQVTTVFDDKDLERLCTEFAESLPLYGHLVFQVMIDQDGQHHFIECNSRFGGASTLGVAAGLNSFYWMLLEAAGEDVAEYPMIRERRFLRMIRHAEDAFQDASNVQ